MTVGPSPLVGARRVLLGLWVRLFLSTLHVHVFHLFHLCYALLHPCIGNEPNA